MHDRHARLAFDVERKGGHVEIINREHYFTLVPIPSVFRGCYECVTRRNLLTVGIGQPLEIEGAVPIATHRGVVVSKAEIFRRFPMASVSPHHLHHLNADRRAEAAVMTIEVDLSV